MYNITYPFKYFATEADLFNYCENHEYFNITAGYEGICFGYQVTEHSANDFDIRLYFDDQLMSGEDGKGVPNQRNPSWDPAQTIPRLDNYKQYAYNGYSMLQNLIANIVLKEVTQVNSATISLMLVPEQAN
jgi:hypothetical protein